jgi:UDP-N-acetyl-D-galactosamine dehydrogenase
LNSGSQSQVVTVLGLTFKEDVPDIRNSKVIDIIRELMNFGVNVQVVDPFADSDEVKHEYGISLTAFADLKPADAVIAAVQHREYKDKGWQLFEKLLKGNKGLVMDVKGYLPRDTKPKNFTLWRL